MHFIFTFAHGGARVGARSRWKKICGVLSLCGKCLGLSPLEQISMGLMLSMLE